LLTKFVSDLGGGQHKPQLKFIYDILFGIILGRSLMLSEIARALQEDICQDQIEKRLGRNLNSDRLYEDLLYDAYLEMVKPLLNVNEGAGIHMGVDYTDIARRFGDLRKGRGSEALGKCWDGSEGKKDPGYPVAQYEVILPGGIHVPLAYHVFSYLDDSFVSQPMEFMKVAEKLRPYLGDEVYWSFDRGFEGVPWFDFLDAQKVKNWVGRMHVSTPNKNDTAERTLAVADGRFLSTYDAAIECTERYTYVRCRGKRSGYRKQKLTVGTRKVWLSLGPNCGWIRKNWQKYGPERTLIVVWGNGRDPMVLLANGWLSTKAEIMKALDAYRGRWTSTEESTRAMKDQRRWGAGLETIRALKLRGIKRMALFAMLAYGFLALMRIRSKGLALRTFKLIGVSGKLPKDPRYRIFRGMGVLLARVRPKIIRRWRRKAVQPPG